MTPYPVIDVKATGRTSSAADRERVHGFGCTAVPEPRVSSVRVSLAGGTDAANIDNFYALSVLLGTTVNDLVVEQESR